jgi:molybdenum cofactor biosynthesis enzyme
LTAVQVALLTVYDMEEDALLITQLGIYYRLAA